MRSAFVQGKAIKTLLLNCRKVVFRYPRMSDSGQMCRNYNRMILGGDYLSRNTPVKKRDTVKCLRGFISRMRKNDAIKIVAVVGGKAL
ncbi:MAG: hypothetical protein HY518_00035 [Candidatus Aenigmarchaeota archaeon]|nr:hypothetical protein [Candidatus Aenigmarchaeota archaeon]